MERANEHSEIGGGEKGECRKNYDEDFKKNAVKLSYASPKSVKEIADDLGIHENLLYNWRRQYTADGDKSM